jgi:hypothetical protein
VKDGYFEHTRGGFTIYTDAENDSLNSARFLLGRFGEDPELLVVRFWREWGDGDYQIVPLMSYGLPPRRALCTKRSLAAALQSVRLEPGSVTEQRWRVLADDLDVAWPTRLRAASYVHASKQSWQANDSWRSGGGAWPPLPCCSKK